MSPQVCLSLVLALPTSALASERRGREVLVEVTWQGTESKAWDGTSGVGPEPLGPGRNLSWQAQRKESCFMSVRCQICHQS